MVRLEVLSAGTSHVEDRSEDVGRGASISVDTEDEDDPDELYDANPPTLKSLGKRRG